MTLSMLYQISPYIAWTIALIELCVCLYILASAFRNQVIWMPTFYILLVALNAFFIGCTFLPLDSGLRLTTTIVLASTSPLVVTFLLPLNLQFFMSSWIFSKEQANSGGITRHSWFMVLGRWLLFTLILLPMLLVAFDIFTGTRLYFTGMELGQTDRFVEDEFASGILTPYIRFGVYQVILVLTLIYLAIISISGRSETDSSHRKYAWLLFGFSLTAGAVELIAQQLMIWPIFLVFSRSILAISYGSVSYIFFRPKISYPLYKFHIRLVVQLFILVVPIFIVMISFILLSYKISTDNFIQTIIGAGLLTLLAFGILILIFIRKSLLTMDSIYHTVEAISQGDLSKNVNVRLGDELGHLAEKINQLALQVKEKVSDFEARLSENTLNLERKSTNLQVAAQVAQRTAAVRNINLLLNDLALMIAEKLNFYHLGIFIVDDDGQFAILQASNSDGGQHLLARGHKLEVGQNSIVGYVAATGRTRMAQDVSTDAMFMPNTDLPRTRAEIALPLKVSGKVIGVLDVQSTHASALSKDNLEVLHLLADQIALAIEGSRSLQESQHALIELNTLYGNQTLRDWQQRLSQRSLAFRYNRLAVDPIEENPISGVMPNTLPGHQLEVPISLHGQNFGSLVLRREPGQPKWTDEDLALVVDAVAQFAPALEYARLLEGIEQRAQLESLVSQISTEIQSSLDLETVLRTSVQEIGRAINTTRIRFRLEETSNSNDQAHEEAPHEE